MKLIDDLMVDKIDNGKTLISNIEINSDQVEQKDDIMKKIEDIESVVDVREMAVNNKHDNQMNNSYKSLFILCAVIILILIATYYLKKSRKVKSQSKEVDKE